MSEHSIAQIGFAAPRKAVDIDTPAVTEESLQRGSTENQQRIFEQGSIAFRRAQRRVDAVLDQPGQSDTGEIGSDKRDNAEDKKMPVAVDEKLNAVVIAKNRGVLFVRSSNFSVGNAEPVTSSTSLRTNRDRPFIPSLSTD
jgi:hypothetical protein